MKDYVKLNDKIRLYIIRMFLKFLSSIQDQKEVFLDQKSTL